MGIGQLRKMKMIRFVMLASFTRVEVCLLIFTAIPTACDVNGQHVIQQDFQDPILAASFDDLFAEWNSLKASIRDINIEAAKPIAPVKRNELKRQFSDRKNAVMDLLPKISAAARSKWILEPNASSEALDWLYNRLTIDATSHRDKSALEHARIMLIHKNCISEIRLRTIYRCAALRAFYLNEFELSRQYLDSLEDIDGLHVGMMELRDSVEEYQGLWKREQQLRDEEKASGPSAVLEIQTTIGTAKIQLLNEHPAVTKVISLAQQGFYDGKEIFISDDRGSIEVQGSLPESSSEKHMKPIHVGRENTRCQFGGSLTVLASGHGVNCTQLGLTCVPPLTQDKSRFAVGYVVDGFEVLEAMRRARPSITGLIGRITEVQISKDPFRSQ